MADKGHEYDMYRESCVYVSAEIQGDLEKKKGVLGTRSKNWCSLQGFTLYLQKKQGDVMKSIDLRESHQVRKVTNEPTGTHFEICVKKKTHVFICPSKDNCTAWVKALQAAIALKSSSHQSTNFATDDPLFTDDKNVYNEVDESQMSVSDCNALNAPQEQPNSPVKLSDYTEPCDKKSGSRKRENDYWDVMDFRSSMGKSGSTSGKINNASSTVAKNFSAEVIHDGAVSHSAQRYDVGGCVYSVVQKDTKNSVSQVASATALNTIANGKGVESKEKTHDKTHPLIATCNTSNVRDANGNVGHSTPETGPAVESVKDEGEILFQILSDALTDRCSPIKDFIHPLTEEDRKPVEELTEFLRKNVEISQGSYSCVPVTDDPVGTLKLYLMTLGISSRK